MSLTGRKTLIQITDDLIIEAFTTNEEDIVWGYDWVESFGINKNLLSDKKSKYHLPKLSKSYSERKNSRNDLRITIPGINLPLNIFTKDEMIEILLSLMTMGHTEVSLLLNIIYKGNVKEIKDSHVNNNNTNDTIEKLEKKVKINDEQTQDVVGFIYLITNDDFIKLGFSTNVTKRIKSLQTSSPKRLKLIKRVKGTIEQEKQLHRKLLQYRVNGEWYRYEHKNILINCLDLLNKR